MTWNYRLVKENGKYSIREVFYREDGAITMLTAEPINFIKQLFQDAWWYIKGFYEAITQPTLKFEDIEFADREFIWEKDIREETLLESVQEDLIDLMKACEELIADIKDRHPDIYDLGDFSCPHVRKIAETLQEIIDR